MSRVVVPRVVGERDAVGAILAAVREAGAARPVVLVDGRSGAGKSELADRLVAVWPQAQLVRLDDVVPGWDGLEESSRAVAGMLRADAPGWRVWDWAADAPGQWHAIDPGRPLVIEGVGSLSAANRAGATLGVWVELDDDERRRRALARDGEVYAPHWERWAAQEEAFIARERPRSRADLVVDRRRGTRGLSLRGSR